MSALERLTFDRGHARMDRIPADDPDAMLPLFSMTTPPSCAADARACFVEL